MDRARLALQGVTVLGGLGAVTALALLGHPVVVPEGLAQGPGLFLDVGSGIGVGSAIGLLVGRRQSVRRDPCGKWLAQGPKGRGTDQPE
jgi:hypothetical protein